VIHLDIYNNPRISKGQAYNQVLRDRNTSSLLTAIDKDVHQWKRKLIAPLLSDRSMRIFEATMLDQINIFLRTLLQASQQNKIVDVSPPTERLAVDVIGQLAFGYQLDTQIDPTHRGVVEGIKRRGSSMTLYFFWERLHFLHRLVDWLIGQEDIHSFHGSLKVMVGARMKIPKDAKHDFYAFTSGDQGLSGEKLWLEALMFIGAGGSTVATAISAALFYLTGNPQTYARLAEEIRGAFTAVDDIRQGPALSGCKYLRAVIDETMRLSPPTLAHTWREQDPSSIAAGEVLTVDGYVVPPGTQVAVSSYTLYHDPQYFPDPYAFRPERWLQPEHTSDSSASEIEASQEQQEAFSAMRHAFIPFLIGDRNCVGKSMAYMEISLVLARTIWCFDFTRASGSAGNLGGGSPGSGEGREKVGEYQLYEGFVVGHEGPNLAFTPREGATEGLL